MYINRYIFHAAVMLLFLYSGSLIAADLTAPLGNVKPSDLSRIDITEPKAYAPALAGGSGGGAVAGGAVAGSGGSSGSSDGAATGVWGSGGTTSGNVSVPDTSVHVTTGNSTLDRVVTGGLTGVVTDMAMDLGSVVAGAVTGGSNSSVGAQNGGAVSGSVGAAGSVIGGAGAGALTGQYDLAALKAALYAWRDRWQKVFEGFTKQGIALKESLARELARCANTYVPGSKAHANCSKSARDSYDAARAALEERLNEAKALSDAEMAKLEEDIQKALSVAFPNVDIPSPTAPEANPANNVPTVGGVCKIGGVWQVCEGVKQGDTVCNVNGVWRSCGSTDAVGSNLGGTVGVNSGANVGVNTSTTVVNNSTTTNTNTSTNTSTNAQVQDIPKFEDLNDFADYCKANPEAFVCAKADDYGESPDVDFGVSEFITQLMGVLKDNGEKGLPDFSLNKFLNSGTKQCPAPLTMQVDKFTAVMSFDWVCRFLLMIKPFVVMCFTIMTTFLVIGGARK